MDIKHNDIPTDYVEIKDGKAIIPQRWIDAISASGEWAVVPVEPTEEMCAKGVLQAERVLRIKDVQLVEMEYVYKAMTQARPKVAG